MRFNGESDFCVKLCEKLPKVIDLENIMSIIINMLTIERGDNNWRRETYQEWYRSL